MTIGPFSIILFDQLAKTFPHWHTANGSCYVAELAVEWQQTWIKKFRPTTVPVRLWGQVCPVISNICMLAGNSKYDGRVQYSLKALLPESGSSLGAPGGSFILFMLFTLTLQRAYGSNTTHAERSCKTNHMWLGAAILIFPRFPRARGPQNHFRLTLIIDTFSRRLTSSGGYSVSKLYCSTSLDASWTILEPAEDDSHDMKQLFWFHQCYGKILTSAMQEVFCCKS
jgi:hypothetical protein